MFTPIDRRFVLFSQFYAMLLSLEIRNYAIIEHVELHFERGLHVLTGETGAGKSILLGALGLILGKRADSSVLLTTEEKCVVEAVFSLQNLNLTPFFSENDLHFEEECIIRREILQNGKSRAFINDSPVQLKTLQELSSQLIELHQQHDTLTLSQQDFQVNVLDSLARNKDLKTAYNEAFYAYKELQKRLNDIQHSAESSAAEIDYWQFQLDELSETELEGVDLEELENEYLSIEHAENIQQALSSSLGLLSGNEASIIPYWRELLAQLRSVKDFNLGIHEVYERLESLLLELNESENDLNRIADKLYIDEESAAQLKTRLDIINRLLKKHQVNSTEALCDIKNELSQKLAHIQNHEALLAETQKAFDKQQFDLQKIAKQLNESRLKIAPVLSAKVCDILANLGMPATQFQVQIKSLPVEQAHANGMDAIDYLFSANKGFSSQEISKIASGGELSRLMLAIKSIVAENMQLPTMVFDEIDTGVSGDVALKLGDLLRNLATHHQIIVITHLPQVAAKGKIHYHIFKDNQQKTNTRVKKLNEQERITELSQMLGGSMAGESARVHALELLKT